MQKLNAEQLIFYSVNLLFYLYFKAVALDDKPNWIIAPLCIKNEMTIVFNRGYFNWVFYSHLYISLLYSMNPGHKMEIFQCNFCCMDTKFIYFYCYKFFLTDKNQSIYHILSFNLGKKKGIYKYVFFLFIVLQSSDISRHTSQTIFFEASVEWALHSILLCLVSFQ